MLAYWWGIVFVISVLYAALRYGGERMITHYVGRSSTPDNAIFYAGTYTSIMAAIMVSFLFASPNASSVHVMLAFCLAETCGGLISQAVFGRENAK